MSEGVPLSVDFTDKGVTVELALQSVSLLTLIVDTTLVNSHYTVTL